MLESLARRDVLLLGTRKLIIFNFGLDSLRLFCTVYFTVKFLGISKRSKTTILAHKRLKSCHMQLTMSTLRAFVRLLIYFGGGWLFFLFSSHVHVLLHTGDYTFLLILDGD